jgi:hypothetical protein
LAQTQVSEPRGSAEKGYEVTITVPIDCVGCKGKKAPNGKDLATYWKQTAEAVWNEAFKKFPLCTNWKGRLVVDIEALGANEPARDGRHRVEVKGPPGWDGIPEFTPGGPEGAPEEQRTPDGTRYYTEGANGRMPANATPTVIQHEIGHLIGLGDDRDVNHVVLSNRVGTLMTGGAKLEGGKTVTWKTPLKIDKNLVERIGRQLANLDKACVQKWSGTLNGTGENRGIAACPDPSSHSGDFAIAVAPDGKATLTGHMVNTSVSVGGFTTQTDFTLEGRQTRSQMSFAPVAAFPVEVNLRISGDRATGITTVNPGNDGVYFVTLDFTADCQNCEREAVS